MALFRKASPAYFVEGDITPPSRSERGVLSWLSRLLGFPDAPRYQPPGPEDVVDPCAAPIGAE
jgi:hypothetical protein